MQALATALLKEARLLVEMGHLQFHHTDGAGCCTVGGVVLGCGDEIKTPHQLNTMLKPKAVKDIVRVGRFTICALAYTLLITRPDLAFTDGELPKPMHPETTLIWWNDEEGRTQEEVLALYDKTLMLLESAVECEQIEALYKKHERAGFHA